MTETTTPTEGAEVVDTGAENTALPVDQSTENSAVENQEDTTSENNSDNGSTDSTNKTAEDEQKADASLKKFAKAQGYTDEDLETLSERELKTLRLAQNQQRAARTQMQKPKGEIEKELNTITPESDLDDRTYTDFRIRQRDMISDIRDYWRDNPEDVKYEAQAIALLQEEKATYGEDSMLKLASNMPRLIREAKYQAGAFDTETIAEQARRDERERLRKVQEGSADGSHATTEQPSNKSEVTQDWVKNEYDPDNPEHRKKMDEYTAGKGKLY